MGQQGSALRWEHRSYCVWQPGYRKTQIPGPGPLPVSPW